MCGACNYLESYSDLINLLLVACAVYDDYKFVTRKELDDLGLEQYIGSNLLRAYMQGFFVDIRLYRKVSHRAVLHPA